MPDLRKKKLRKSTTSRLNVPVECELYEEFRLVTVKQRIKMTEVIREFLEKYIEEANRGN